jgi:AraC-like DNA-binding protein
MALTDTLEITALDLNTFPALADPAPQSDGTKQRPAGKDAQGRVAYVKWMFCPVRAGNGHVVSSIDGTGTNRLSDVARTAAQAIRRSEMAICEYHSEERVEPTSVAFPTEDAYAVTHFLRDYPDHRYWENKNQAPASDIQAGETVICDLKRSPRILIDKPSHTLCIFLPRAAFNLVADETGSRRIGELNYRPGAGTCDRVIASLAASLRAAFDYDAQTGGFIAGWLGMATAAHLARAYGGLQPTTNCVTGGLAPWQVRRAKEIFDASLNGGVTIQRVAEACRLSAGHFGQAFKKSTGNSPHQWLIKRRVEAAKALMSDSSLPLGQIAVSCGFSDQSHFSRVFARETSVSPGAWRRSLPRKDVAGELGHLPARA